MKKVEVLNYKLIGKYFQSLKNAIQFRIWTNKVSKEYLVKEFIISQQSKVKPDTLKLIENNILVALTFIFAESIKDKEHIRGKVIVNLTNENN